MSPRAALQRLESLQAAGLTHLPRATSAIPPASPTPPDGVEHNSPVPQQLAAQTEAAVVSQSAVADRQDRLVLLDIIATEVAQCTRCQELASTRKQTVFGVGNPCPRLCFVGEAPGADEDQQGEPFVGRAGQLLNKIIEACGLKRRDVYILNAIKCRPPGNRTPKPEEMANCRGFFHRQLEILRPDYICCLGAVAARAVLATESPLGRLRGRFHELP